MHVPFDLLLMSQICLDKFKTIGIMKANNSLECRINELENKVNALTREKKGKINEAKSVLSFMLILEKLWKLIRQLFSDLEL